MRSRALDQGWRIAESNSYYDLYLSLLAASAAECKAGLITMEMLLFAHAPKLSTQI